MATDNSRPDVAVFIDFENVYVSVRDKLDANPNFESIMDRCEDLGRVVIARAYADWYRYPRVTSALYANGIEPMYVPTYYYDRDLGRTGRAIKNSVDMNLCVDAMKTLYTNPNIAKFVLATGDRDFIPLVNTIRQQGKEVIVIGIGGAASSHLAQSADEFIFYESLIGKKPSQLLQDQPRAKMPEKGREVEPPEEQTQRPAPPRAPEQPVVAEPRAQPAEEPDVYDVLVQAIGLARERGYVCSFGSLKLLMKELMGGEFRESRYRDLNGKPFAKFKDFVLDAERRGKVQVFTNGTVNEVFLPDEDPYSLSQFAQELKEEPAPLDMPEVRVDGRSLSGRPRRRRRPRGGPRPAGQGAESAEQAPEVLLDVDQVAEGVDETTLYTAPVAEEQQAAPAGAALDELLDQLVSVEPEPVEHAAELPERVEAPEILVENGLDFEVMPVGEVVADVPVGRPFEDAEWDVLRQAVSELDRPVSFVQIHDALREARNRNEISRTNEELRTLIKQAINTGLLLRSGKGSKIVYRLAPPAETEEAPVTDIGETAPDQTTMVEEALEADAAAESVVAEPPADEGEAPAKPRQRSRSRRKPAAATAEPAAPEAIAEAPAPETEAPQPKKASRRRRPTASAEADAPPAAQGTPETEAPQPKKTSRRRKAPAVPEPTPIE